MTVVEITELTFECKKRVLFWVPMLKPITAQQLPTHTLTPTNKQTNKQAHTHNRLPAPVLSQMTWSGTSDHHLHFSLSQKKLNLFAVCLFMQLRAILCLKKKKSSNGFSKNTTQNTPATSWVSRLSLPSRLLRHPLNRSLHKHGTCDGVMPRPIERSGVKLSNRTAHYISVPRL